MFHVSFLNLFEKMKNSFVELILTEEFRDVLAIIGKVIWWFLRAWFLLASWMREPYANHVAGSCYTDDDKGGIVVGIVDVSKRESVSKLDSNDVG